MSSAPARRTAVLVVLAVVLAAVAGTVWYRWYHSEEQQERRFLDDLSAMPGVTQVRTLHGRSVELSPQVTPDEAVAVRSAVHGRDPGWSLTIGPAHLDLDLGEAGDTRGATLLALVGNAGLTDDRVREVAFLESDEATVFVTPVEPADELTLLRVLADELAAQPDEVPDGTRIRGDDVVVAHPDATADPQRLARDLAAVEDLAEVTPRRVTFGERCWVDVDAEDADAVGLWSRVAGAVDDAPCAFSTSMSVDGPARVQGPSSSDPARAVALAADLLASGAERVAEVTTDLTSVNATAADAARAERVLDAAARDVPGQRLRVHWGTRAASSSVIGPARAAREAFPGVAALSGDDLAATWWQDEDGAVSVSVIPGGDDATSSDALRRTSTGVRAVGWEGEAEVTLGVGEGDGSVHRVELASTDDGPAAEATATDPERTGDGTVREVRRAWDATAGS